MTFRLQSRHGGRATRDGSRGQSEVVGAILLVALVIVAAAAASEFVFGLGVVTSGAGTVGPQASFGTTVADGGLTIEHLGGNELDTDEITVQGSSNGEYGYHVGDRWTPGETITLEPDDGETIRIVWRSSESHESDVLLEYEYDG